MDAICLESSTLKIEFDCHSGSLVSIYSKISDWYVFNRPQLTLSWRIMLPLKGRRNNNAWGHLQKTPPVCESGNGFVRFNWPRLESEFGGIHDISVSTECRIKENQAVFSMHIKNEDKAFVENVFYPYIGDLHRPAEAK